MDEAATYAWTITGTASEEQDHKGTGFRDTGAIGVSGPHNATEADIVRAVKEGHRFRLYDDDGIFYYEGRLWAAYMDDHETEPYYAPLRDFGIAYAGCTKVGWPGNPQWDCG